MLFWNIFAMVTFLMQKLVVITAGETESPKLPLFYMPLHVETGFDEFGWIALLKYDFFFFLIIFKNLEKWLLSTATI